jgi:hypothetical protein
MSSNAGPCGWAIMEPNLRNKPQSHVNLICWIVTSPNSEPQQCQLCDASDHGGKIVFPDVGKVPDKFILLLTVDGKVARTCEVAWRSDKEIGLRFLGKASWPPEVPSKVTPLDA